MALARGQTLPKETLVGESGFEVIKHFDFDERKLGNYEDLPRYWERCTGDGLPHYSSAQFDDEVGYPAAPSFRFDLRGGNICYEYDFSDLLVLPDADYLITAVIRTEGLEHARAVLEACFIDRMGQPLPGSARLSPLIGGTTKTADAATSDRPDEAWRRVEIAVPGDYAGAYGLRLRLWVLQEYVWWTPRPTDLDPIFHHDVEGTAWFDDIVIHRLPRLRLRLSARGNVVLAGQPARLIIEIQNPTPSALKTELRVLTEAGAQVFQQMRDLPARAADPADVELPALPAGLYEAQLHLRAPTQDLLYRVLRFAVLPELGDRLSPPRDVGVDLGRWPEVDLEGQLELLRALGAGAALVDVPLSSRPPLEGGASADGRGGGQTGAANSLRELARRLIGAGVDSTGVLVISDIPGGERPAALLELAARGPASEAIWGVPLAQVGGLLTSWQVGRSDEAAPTRWNIADLAALQARMKRFVRSGLFVLPQSALSGAPAGAAAELKNIIWSDHVAAALPAWSFPRQLEFLVATGKAAQPMRPSETPAHWLRLEPADIAAGGAARFAEVARRVIMAKALSPQRVYVPAPWRLREGGSRTAWEPTAAFIPLRTLFHFLGNSRPIGVLPLPDQDALLVFFRDRDRACAAAWTWRAVPLAEPAAIYLGPAPEQIDLFGRRSRLALKDGRALVPLGPTPIVIDGIDAPLALLAARFRVAPDFVEAHDVKPQPVLSLRNPYDQPLRGTLELTPPADWVIEPLRTHVELPPGGQLVQPLTIAVPPRELSGVHFVTARLALERPVQQELQLAAPLTVGLHQVEVQVEARWEEDTLLIEQTLVNSSRDAVGFTAFCQLPGRALLEGAFLDVGSGQSQTQVYRLPVARALAGSMARLGVREIRGSRALHQLVQIPR